MSAYLDFAELQARSARPMHMADWIAKLDDFLRLSERDILTHAGQISPPAGRRTFRTPNTDCMNTSAANSKRLMQAISMKPQSV